MVDRSLLSSPAPARFRLHDLLRRYAAERLDDPAAAARRHAAFFLTRLADWEQDLERGDPGTLAAAAAQWEELRAAWAWATSDGAVDLLSGAAAGYAGLCLLRNWAAEGLLDVETTLATLDAAAPPLLAGRLAVYGARLARSAGDNGRALTLAIRAQEILAVENRPVERAHALLVQAAILVDQGDLGRGRCAAP